MVSERRSLRLIFALFVLIASLAIGMETLSISSPAHAASCPTSCGSYTVSGLGSRKQQILNTGGNSLDLAIAMEETEHMDTSYPYGDQKTRDASNWGIFKQNWYMLRLAVPQYQPYDSSAWEAGAALNTNLSWDIQCRHTSQNYFGIDKWFGGHRNGQTGLANPYTQDISNYKNAIYWIQSQIDSGHTTDDTRFWVDIPAI